MKAENNLMTKISPKVINKAEIRFKNYQKHFCKYHIFGDKYFYSNDTI